MTVFFSFKSFSQTLSVVGFGFNPIPTKNSLKVIHSINQVFIVVVWNTIDKKKNELWISPKFVLVFDVGPPVNFRDAIDTSL